MYIARLNITKVVVTMNVATCILHLISAPYQPGRKLTYHYIRGPTTLLSEYLYCELGNQHQKSSDIDIDCFYPKYCNNGVKLLLNFCTSDYIHCTMHSSGGYSLEKVKDFPPKLGFDRAYDLKCDFKNILAF